METNGLPTKRTMWDGPTPNPTKQLWPIPCAVCNTLLESEEAWKAHVCGQSRAVDDGVNYDADVLETDRVLETDVKDGLSVKGKTFNPEPEDEQDTESDNYSAQAPVSKLFTIHEIKPVTEQSRDSGGSASFVMNGLELRTHSDRSWIGTPEKIDLLKKIGHAAARKYPDQAVKIEPRDNTTQEIYTLSIRPKSLQRVDSLEKLRANDWVGVSGGTLASILEHCQKGLGVILLALCLTRATLAAPEYSYRSPASSATVPTFETEGKDTDGDRGFDGLSPADLSYGDLAMYCGVVIGTPLLCLLAYFWLRNRHEQRGSVLVDGDVIDFDTISRDDGS